MSRMYDNKPLENLPVHITKWDGDFSDLSDLSDSSREHPGILCDGKVVKQARITVTFTKSSTSQAGLKFYLLFLSIERAHKRKYDETGKEQEPNFTQTTKVSKGYLNSSYDVQSRGQTDRLSVEETLNLIHNSKVAEMIAPVVATQHTTGDFALLMREEDRLKVELGENSLVRIKTCGNSPFVESLVVRDDLTSTKSNYAGDEKMGDAWLERIAAAKAVHAKEVAPPSEIAEEEWDD